MYKIIITVSVQDHAWNTGNVSSTSDYMTILLSVKHIHIPIVIKTGQLIYF